MKDVLGRFSLRLWDKKCGRGDDFRVVRERGGGEYRRYGGGGGGEVECSLSLALNASGG